MSCQIAKNEHWKIMIWLSDTKCCHLAIHYVLPKILPGPNLHFRFMKNCIHTSPLGSLLVTINFPSRCQWNSLKNSVRNSGPKNWGLHFKMNIFCNGFVNENLMYYLRTDKQILFENLILKLDLFFAKSNSCKLIRKYRNKQLTVSSWWKVATITTIPK